MLLEKEMEYKSTRASQEGDFKYIYDTDNAQLPPDPFKKKETSEGVFGFRGSRELAGSVPSVNTSTTGGTPNLQSNLSASNPNPSVTDPMKFSFVNKNEWVHSSAQNFAQNSANALKNEVQNSAVQADKKQ